MQFSSLLAIFASVALTVSAAPADPVPDTLAVRDSDGANNLEARDCAGARACVRDECKYVAKEGKLGCRLACGIMHNCH
jgi:hypothetical protein